MTPSGIETATFRLVAQFLSQLCHRVPQICLLLKYISEVCRNFFAQILEDRLRKVLTLCLLNTCKVFDRNATPVDYWYIAEEMTF